MAGWCSFARRRRFSTTSAIPAKPLRRPRQPSRSDLKDEDQRRKTKVMIDVPVLNVEGKEVGKFAVDEALLGTTVRPQLLKQAYVRYHANNRQGTVATKDRGEV